MNKRAFTLIELLIVIAIAVIITGALVPLFSVTKQDAKRAKALSELEAIKTACLQFHQDTGQWPIIYSLTGADLIENTRNLVDWQGPYLDRWPDDPWGNPYVLREFGADNYYYACSFGDDGVWDPNADPKILVTANYYDLN